MMPDKSAYQREKKKRCQWCSNLCSGVPSWRVHIVHGDLQDCTAPTIEEFCEEQAKRIAALEQDKARMARGIAAMTMPEKSAYQRVKEERCRWANCGGVPTGKLCSVAEVFFSISAAMLLGRVAWWLGFERPPESSWFRMCTFAFFVFGGSGILWYAAIRWIEGLRPARYGSCTIPQTSDQHNRTPLPGKKQLRAAIDAAREEYDTHKADTEAPR